MTKAIPFFGAALALALTAGCAMVAEPPPEPPPEMPPKDVYESLAMIGETMEFLKANYVDADRATQQRLLEGALRGMLQELDPYSTYDPPREWEDNKSRLTGERVGVGITVVKNDREPLTIIGVVSDSPAARAGLKPGDRVMEINGRPTLTMSFEHCREEVTGPAGSELNLAVIREGEDNKLSFKLIRSKLALESGELSKVRLFERGVGYLKLDSFNRLTASFFDRALEKLRKDGELKGLIIDLRNNPGGTIDAAVELASRLLPPGSVVFEAVSRNDRQPYRALTAKVKHPDLTLPVAVLINGYSASASEIVAGALQDHHRALIVGDRSFGKGSIQRSFPLPNGGAIRFTIAGYRTPDGKMIDRQGVTPNVEIPTSDREALNPGPPENDRQLQTALRLMRKAEEKAPSPEKKENFSTPEASIK